LHDKSQKNPNNIGRGGETEREVGGYGEWFELGMH